METPVVNPTEIQKAFQLTRPYWTELSERHEGLDEIAEEVARSPLLQLMNRGQVESMSEFVYDIRSAVALRVNGLVMEREIQVFDRFNGLFHLYQAMVLTVRALRERVDNYQPDELVYHARLNVFHGALVLLAREMREPADVIFAMLNQLELTPEVRRHLLPSILEQSLRHRQALVLH